MKGFLISMMVVIFATGCTKVVYRNKYIPKEVYVPIKPQIPNIHCYFDGEDETEVLNKYIECIVKHKKLLDVLRGEEQVQ